MAIYSRYSRNSNQTTQSAPSPMNFSDDEIDLMQVFGVLWFQKWKIIAIAVLITALGVGYAITSTPIYQANGMVEFVNSKNQVLGDLSDVVGGIQKTPADSEVDMIKSRRVLGKTVRDLNLHIDIVPDISRWAKLKHFLSRTENPSMNNNMMQPEVVVAKLRLPEYLYDKSFKLRVLSPTTFSLMTPTKQNYTGKVGVPLKIGQDGELIVEKIVAEPNQEFDLTHYSDLTSIENINKNLSVAPKSKNSPMIGLTLNGTNPTLIQTILNQIMQNYAAENRNKDIQAASNGLRFIDEELPRLKNVLQEAENALNAYRAQSGSIDVPQEAKGVLENLNKIEMQLVDLRTEQAVLNEVYTREHPSQKALQDKIQILNESKAKLNNQITKMPSMQQDIIRLTRNVEINQGIYVQLLSKQQELNILKASSEGNVRIIDSAATPPKPIKPKKLIIVLLAGMIGLLFGSGFYLIKSFINQGIHDEDEIEALGLDVIVSIPISHSQQKRDSALKRFSKKKYVRSNSMLVLKDPTDIAVEALRALRTNLFFSSMSAVNKVIMISGATPEVGKSFVAANLAVLMAQAGKKVLLIDGDMRKGYMHHLLSMPSSEGFAEILASSDTQYTHNIWKTNLAGLHFVSGGNTPKNPSELLLNKKIEKFLVWADAHYDYVVLDTPPILAVTDAAVMGQYAGIRLLVSRFGRTSWQELDACVSRFEASNVRINGVILNGVERSAKNYYSYDDYNEKYGKYGTHQKSQRIS